MKVSRSAYYQWLKGKPSERSIENQNLTVQIKRIYSLSKKRYGSPKIAAELREMGQKASRPRVARIMKREGLYSIIKKKYKVCTTDSKHSLPIAPNILNQGFVVSEPGKVWMSDITYIRSGGSWLYLTAVMDLFDRKVIGWAMSKGMSACETTIPALRMALNNRIPSDQLIFHSDRGVQYACNDFRTVLIRHRINQSMSRKGNCYDNAVMECFFKILKSETQYAEYRTDYEARMNLFEFIECWYNRYRKHAALGYLSPEQFGNQYIKSAA
jgi:transposase InsO family protein